jgi:hypothetical protein
LFRAFPGVQAGDQPAFELGVTVERDASGAIERDPRGHVEVRFQPTGPITQGLVGVRQRENRSVAESSARAAVLGGDASSLGRPHQPIRKAPAACRLGLMPMLCVDLAALLY